MTNISTKHFCNHRHSGQNMVEKKRKKLKLRPVASFPKMNILVDKINSRIEMFLVSCGNSNNNKKCINQV